jgi:hypothetical protein
MRLDDALLPNATLTPVSGPSAPADEASSKETAASASGLAFKQAWNEVQSVRTVQAGENLVGIVRQHAQSQGLNLTSSQALRWAQSLAAHNGMPNANRIYPGQQLQMSALTAQWQETGTERSQPLSAEVSNPTQGVSVPARTTAEVLSAQTAQRNASAVKPTAHVSTALPNRASNATIPKSQAQALSSPPAQTGASILGTPHPVLDKTLDRAVSKGFIPANEKQDVYQKVLQMASKHGFAPDDFARMTLMESDGMNPKATNQRCHGIIQFCDGPARGAAAVGMANNPKSILNLSVYQQLHLADTYFQKAGLNKPQGGNVPLDDLYLSVLQPAARSETRVDAPLGIPGAQAGALYNDKNNNPSITRQSLVRGLVQNAQRVLGLDRAEIKRPDNRAQTPSAPTAQVATGDNTQALSRLQTQRLAKYQASNSAPTQLR